MFKPPLDIIAHYERIAQISSQMRAAVEREDWPLFNKLESSCQSAIDELRQINRSQVISPEIFPVRQRVLRQVLEDDANIRHRLQPALSEALTWGLRKS